MPLDQDQWTALAASVRSGECTPFLGAGASVPKLPLGADLSKELAAEYKFPLKDKTNLPAVAQFITIKTKDHVFLKDKIIARLKNSGYPEFSGDEPHHILAKFQLPIYLTTNYDDFMYQALLNNGRQPSQEYCRWAPRLTHPPGPLSNPTYAPTPRTPLVYHLHGCYMQSKALVLTEYDYLEFIYNIALSGSIGKTVDRAWEMFPSPIIQAISNNTLVFIGYSLSDWDFRIIFRWLVLSLRGIHTRIKVAVQFSKKTDPAASLAEESLIEDYLDTYFQNLFEVSVFWGEARSFVKRLEEEVQKLG